MVVLAAALPLLTLAEGVPYLMGVAVLMGAAQALVFPSTLALVSNSVGDHNLATGLGLLGTLKNGGKVAGPAIGGLMVHWLDYDLTFQLMAAALLASAIVVRLRPGLVRRSRRGPVPA
jgi:predicted MFS family arabinose efflux permease